MHRRDAAVTRCEVAGLKHDVRVRTGRSAGAACVFVHAASIRRADARARPSESGFSATLRRVGAAALLRARAHIALEPEMHQVSGRAM